MDELTMSCKDCKAEYTMSESHVAWFHQRDLTVPRRCEACLRKRRAERPHQQAAAPTPAARRPATPIPWHELELR